MAVNVEAITLVAGLILSNGFAVAAFIDKRSKKRYQEVLEQGLVPLKYFEQIQQSQANYIATLEGRVVHALELWRQSELNKEEVRNELEKVQKELVNVRRTLDEATAELKRYRHE